MRRRFEIDGRPVGPQHPPLVIAEIGINHEGDVRKAMRIVDDAQASGCECVKFQCHVIEDEMVPNDVVPGNAAESIWEIMSRCALTEEEERALKDYVEERGMIYLSTPFSRAAAVRLEAMGVSAYKIGSGECNNYPLVRHIAAYGKPIILSTGMNDLASVAPSVGLLREARVPFALLHCTSIYPTPHDRVRLGGMQALRERFPDAIVGLSDHSVDIWSCLGAAGLGASILEKHFTSDKSWPGPDVPISMDPAELKTLIDGSRAIHLALGGSKDILAEEQPTIDFAYASVVTIADVRAGDTFSAENIWVKRPGTGQILAADFDGLLGRRAARDVPRDMQLSWEDVEPEVEAAPPTRCRQEERARKVVFLTGTRADFGKVRPLMDQVETAAGFEAHVFATGMHMLARYGSTVREIEKAGFRHIYRYINQDASVNSQMDMVLANTVQGLGHYIRESRPDLIVVHGDRVEALAGAIVGALNNILVAHIEGGERSGTVDELLRHAVTKLSHIHFVANEEARRRLLQMGEQSDAVFAIGSPDVDVMLSDRLPSLEQVRLRYEIDFDEYGILIFHPVTTETDSIGRQIEAVVEGVRESGRSFVVIYPNNDVGADRIVEAIVPLEEEPRFRVLPSMRFEYFLTLLRGASVIVGNSSAGIREAPVYGVPTVNVGTRQMGRFRHDSILNVPTDAAAIARALENLPAFAPPSLHFGGGNSAEHFMAALRTPELWRIPWQKQFQDRGFEDLHSLGFSEAVAQMLAAVGVAP